MHDMVVRGGTVVDGTGQASRRADVAVDGERIVAVGRVHEQGRVEIDAEGRIVTPGFIDGHTHFDAQVFWDQLGSSSCYHGVTTAVMGNTGFTLAPCHDDQRALVIRNLERAEDMSPAALRAGIPWSWESFPDYLDAVDRLPKAINYAANVGHSALRTAVMGERAFSTEASPDELAAMASQLRAAMRAGAIGFTTSRSKNHATSDTRPVASLISSWAEIDALVHVCGQERGIFELAVDYAWRSDDPAVRAADADLLHDLAISSGATITFGLLPQRPDGDDWREKLALIDRVVADGGRMVGQSHCRGVTNVLSFRTVLPFDGLAPWRRIRSLSVPDQQRALGDPAVRAELVAAVHSGAYGDGKGGEPKKVPFDKIRVLDTCLPPHRSVADVAAARGCDPVEAMIDLALESDFNQLFFQPFSLDDEPALEEIMTHPQAVMTFSDSGAHVSQIADSSLQTYFLSYWVRNRGLMSLEEGVKRVTGAAAAGWGLTDRGVLSEGAIADLNVIDYEQLLPELPTIALDFPAHTPRLLQKARGIDATVIGGQLVFSKGEHTGALPGRLLRHAQDGSTS